MHAQGCTFTKPTHSGETQWKHSGVVVRLSLTAVADGASLTAVEAGAGWQPSILNSSLSGGELLT